MKSNITNASQFVESVFTEMCMKEIKLGFRSFVMWLVVACVTCCGVEARKYASIVVDVETGHIHHEANPDTITYPASLTKMMTLYLTFKALREGRLTLHQKLKVSKHASRQSPSKLYLKPGSTITVQQAIYALVTKSANDVAVVLAEAIGKTESKFAQKMTAQAKRLGMKKTVFKNASGLPNSKQVTTARDMAILSISLYRDFPEYFSYFKKQSFTYKGQKHRNHNRLLGKVKGVDGIKTGFINASGFNLAASVVRDNKRIVAVVLGGRTSRSRDKHMIDLLERTYTKIKKFGNTAVKSMKRLIGGVSPVHRKIHKPKRARHIPIPMAKPGKFYGPGTKKIMSKKQDMPMPPVRRVPSLRTPKSLVPLPPKTISHPQSLDELVHQHQQTPVQFDSIADLINHTGH